MSEILIEVNGETVLNNGFFAYDGCHKIYVIEDNADMEHAKSLEYDILPIELLEKAYNNSCSLRFIRNWKLNKSYVGQFKNAEFNIVESV